MLTIRPPRLKSGLILLTFLLFSTSIWAKSHKSNSKQQEKVEKLSAKLKKQPDNLKLRYQVAKLNYRANNYKKTIELLDSYSSDLDKNGLSVLALAFKKSEDYKNEARILQLMIATNPKDVSTLLRLGNSYITQASKLEGKSSQEKLSEAVEQYRKITKIQPENEKAYFGLLEIFKKQKNQYESQVVVKDMIKRFGKKPKYVNELCRIYTEEAYLQEAIKTCKQAIMGDPKLADNHANLAQSYKDKGELQTAEQILKTATRRFKKSERIYSMAGEFYFEQKNIRVANRFYSQAVLIDRNSLRAQIGMARSSFQLEKYEQALMGFENACKLDNKNSIRYFKEAVTKLRLDGKHRWERKFNSSLFRCM